MTEHYFLKGSGDIKGYIAANARQLFLPYSADPKFPIDDVVESHLRWLEQSELIGLPRTEGGAAVERSPFDSDEIGVKVFKLAMTYPITASTKGLDPLVADMNKAVSGLGCSLMIARVDARNVAFVQALERSGHVVCDVLTTYSLIPEALVRFDSEEVRIRDGRPTDAHWMIDMSVEGFSFSHYFNSPWVDENSARRIIAKWIINSVTGYADRVLVAEYNNEPIGYITLKKRRFSSDYSVDSIDLIAVSDAHRGKRVGRALISRAVDSLLEGDSLLYVGTQAQNTAACRMYEAVGFRQVALAVTLHKQLDAR